MKGQDRKCPYDSRMKGRMRATVSSFHFAPLAVEPGISPPLIIRSGTVTTVTRSRHAVPWQHWMQPKCDRR